jgi:beta-glucanase (GH16 family)
MNNRPNNFKILLFQCITIVVLFGGASCTEKDDESVPTVKPIEDKNWTFSTEPVWQDEFDVTGKPLVANWTFETGGGGWGNNELQYYTKGNNVNIENGVLTIEARNEVIENNNFTSTRMITKGKNSFLYGRFEARIKVPTGKGTWPAFWMLPDGNSYGIWPKSGEIDIMEHVGKKPNEVLTSIHTDANNGGNSKTGRFELPTATTDFNIYRVDWTPYAVRGYVNDTKIFEYINGNTGFKTWPFDKKFFIILNVAVGGNLGGPEVDNSIFPAKMLVDYVRVYSLVN